MRGEVGRLATCAGALISWSRGAATVFGRPEPESPARGRDSKIHALLGAGPAGDGRRERALWFGRSQAIVASAPWRQGVLCDSAHRYPASNQTAIVVPGGSLERRAMKGSWS